MTIVKYRYLFLSIAAVLVFGSAIVIGVKGIRLGTEFTGGAVAGIVSQKGYTTEQSKELAGKMDNALSNAYSTDKAIVDFITPVTPIDAKTFELRLGQESDFTLLENELKAYPDFQIAYETVVGPSLGKELLKKSLWALAFVLVAILVFIAFAFSGIDEARKKFNLGPSSWVYGGAALIALLHDVLIPTGIFVLLGKEVTSLYVVGMLSILGLSVSDTIVVFDRIREHMHTAKQGDTFMTIVGASIKDTFTRSINTTVVLMLTLIALLAFGPAATHDLALVMLLGSFFGAYSSIFVASNLLTLFTKKNKKS